MIAKSTIKATNESFHVAVSNGLVLRDNRAKRREVVEGQLDVCRFEILDEILLGLGLSYIKQQSVRS